MLIASDASGAVIKEFYPCALSGDEYFSISCRGEDYFSLRNWSVTDGEGEIRFTSDFWLFPGKSFYVTRNATSFWDAYGKRADISLDSPDTWSLVKVNGSFKLGDAGDSLALWSSDGRNMDSVKYGSSNDSLSGWSGSPIPSLRRGEVAKRLEVGGQLVDTDTAADWQPFREFRYGYTELSSPGFDVDSGAITAFTSPDCSLDAVSNAIDDARRTVSICTYEFSSLPICGRILSALDRGVKVRLMVDGTPAGDMGASEAACLSALSSAGCEVMEVNGNLSSGIVRHIGALHAKYMVIDSTSSIIMSENLVEDGLPQDRIFGNRGWGVKICDAQLADFLQEIFDSDARPARLDVSDWRADPRFNASSELPKASEGADDGAQLASIVTTQPASVTVIASPDGSLLHPFLLDIIHARKAVVIQQFQADLYWTSRWTGGQYLNPIVKSLLSLSVDGVDERVLFDSSWFNAERNKQLVSYLRENAAADSSMSVGLLDERSPVTLLHNKGLVIDGRISAITSNNWVSASFSRNRELAVVIDSQEVASYFLKAFDLDWYSDDTPPECDAGPDLESPLGRSIVLDSSACSDDRIISEYCWDFDADGIIDSREARTLFNGTVPGQHVVVLKVIDAWGNSASDELLVTVVAPLPLEKERGGLNVPRQLWVVPILIVFGLLATKAVKKRKDDTDSRNLNHRPRS